MEQKQKKRRKDQTAATPEEQAIRASELRTQGRKGCKAARICMAFTPDNHEFLKVMSKASGKTLTEFCNLVIEAYRREHPEIMRQAAYFLSIVNSGEFSDLLGDTADKKKGAKHGNKETDE